MSRKISNTRPLAVLASLLVLGFAVGRFVLFEPASSEASAPRRPPGAAAQVAALERAVMRDPEDLGSLQSLAEAYLQRSLDTLDTSYYPLADKALDQADALAPDLDRTVIARGVLELGRHDFAAAREAAQRVLDRKPADADALAVAFDASIELGFYEEAARHLQRLLDLRPGLPAYSRLSYLRELNGDVTGAVVAMREANVAAGRTGNAGVTTFLGDLHLGQGNLSEAEAEYRTALRISSGYPNAALGLARVHAARGDVERAIELLEQTDRRSPSPTVAELLGDLEAGRGRTRAAARWYQRVRELTQEQVDAGEDTALELALFEAEHAHTTADVAKALAIARRAYAARPANIFVNHALALALLRAGDVANAGLHIEQALRLGTQNARFHYHAALIADAAGDTASARVELARAFEINPWFSFYDRSGVEAFAARINR